MEFSDAYLDRKIKKLEHQLQILHLSLACHRDWKKRLDRDRGVRQIKAVQMTLFDSNLMCAGV